MTFLSLSHMTLIKMALFMLNLLDQPERPECLCVFDHHQCPHKCVPCSAEGNFIKDRRVPSLEEGFTGKKSHGLYND